MSDTREARRRRREAAFREAAAFFEPDGDCPDAEDWAIALRAVREAFPHEDHLQPLTDALVAEVAGDPDWGQDRRQTERLGDHPHNTAARLALASFMQAVMPGHNPVEDRAASLLLIEGLLRVELLDGSPGARLGGASAADHLRDIIESIRIIVLEADAGQ